MTIETNFETNVPTASGGSGSENVSGARRWARVSPIYDGATTVDTVVYPNVDHAFKNNDNAAWFTIPEGVTKVIVDAGFLTAIQMSGHFTLSISRSVSQNTLVQFMNEFYYDSTYPCSTVSTGILEVVQGDVIKVVFYDYQGSTATNDFPLCNFISIMEVL